MYSNIGFLLKSSSRVGYSSAQV
ncbi:hypothetical protein Gotur_012956 [Gossypium turneri]